MIGFIKTRIQPSSVRGGVAYVPVPEFHQEQQSNESSKVEGPRAPDSQLLDREERIVKGIEAKLDIVETSFFEIGETYPNLDVEGAYEQLCKLTDEGSFNSNGLEGLVDALDNATFSEQGVQKFNALVKGGKTLYLSNLLINNYQTLQQPELADLTDQDYQIVLKAFNDLRPIVINADKSQGDFYNGRRGFYDHGDRGLVLKLYYGPKSSATATRSGGREEVDVKSVDTTEWGKSEETPKGPESVADIASDILATRAWGNYPVSVKEDEDE